MFRYFPTTTTLSLALALLLAFSSLSLSAEPVKAKKVLYIGIDGCRFDAIQKAEAPAIDALIEKGAYTGHCLILGDRYRKNDTISGPGWSTILTGVWADKHGVHNNTFKGSQYDKFPCLFDLVKKKLPTARCVSHVTWEPIDKFIITAADEKKSYEQKPHTIADYVKYDTEATDASVKELKEQNPDIVFLYIGQVDVTGHTHGFHPTVPQYIEAIERADGHVAAAVAAMKSRPTFDQEDWLVVVTSDHGGKGTNHSSGHEVPEILNSFLIMSGSDVAPGEIAEQCYLVDGAATVIHHLTPLDPAWQLDGTPRGKTKQ